MSPTASNSTGYKYCVCADSQDDDFFAQRLPISEREGEHKSGNIIWISGKVIYTFPEKSKTIHWE